MSLIGKHFYRTAFLGSEEWQTLRIAALARDQKICAICGFDKASNDAHHIFYPESVWETQVEHLVTLCRNCHDLVHVILPSSPESLSEGKANFELLKKSLSDWIGIKTKQLRKQINKGDACWFCGDSNSLYRMVDFKDLGVSKTMPNKAICDRCFAALVNSPKWNVMNPWKAIRIMFRAKLKKQLTDTHNSDSVLVTGPESPEIAE